jgi:hypothetical protein
VTFSGSDWVTVQGCEMIACFMLQDVPYSNARNNECFDEFGLDLKEAYLFRTVSPEERMSK